MPRETASSRVSKKTPSRASTGRVSRKAPTPLGRQAEVDKALRKQMLISIGAFFVIVFGSVGIGVADEGQINVEAVVEERNERIAAENEGRPEGEKLERVNLKRQGQDNRPDGGLQGLGKVEPPKPQPTASSTASSTDDGTASSTDEVVDEAEEATEESVSDVPEEDTSAVEEGETTAEEGQETSQ